MGTWRCCETRHCQLPDNSRSDPAHPPGCWWSGVHTMGGPNRVTASHPADGEVGDAVAHGRGALNGAQW